MIGNAGGLGIGACRPDLLWRNVDRGNMGACFARKMDRKATPAGDDLGNGHAGLQLQLTGGMYQFIVLRLFECVMLGLAKISAGILHLIIEKQPIKLGRNVVMVTGVSSSKPDRISLMPTPKASPHSPHQSL